MEVEQVRAVEAAKARAVLEVVRAVLRVVVMEVEGVQAAVSEVEMALEDLVMVEVVLRVLAGWV